jgi:hypothetical protein
MSKYFIPGAIALLYLWLKKFRDSISVYAAALGLAPLQVTALQNSCDAILNKIDTAGIAEDKLKSARKDRDLTIKTELAAITKAIGDFKRVAGYTEVIGQALGVIGDSVSFDPESYKPVIKGEAFPGYVNLTYSKLGVDGLNFYSRIKGTADWKFIGFDIESPFHDTIALSVLGKPETREYSAIGILNDIEIGQRSDVVVITFGG